MTKLKITASVPS